MSVKLPSLPDALKELEQLLGFARMMSESLESTYVTVDALSLVVVMKAAGWKPNR